MSAPLAIRYTAPPTLARMMRSDGFARCAVGPFGSGKSSACVVELLRRACQQAPGPTGKRRTRAAVVRNTYRELKDTTLKTFLDWIPEGPLGRFSQSDFTFRLAFGEVESEILFRALDDAADVKKLLSLELSFAYVNELREVPKVIFDGLHGRVGRFPAVKDGGCTWRGVWADTNPWHLGHWGYRLFSRDKPPGFEVYEQPDGLGPAAENIENLPPQYYQLMSAGKDAEWVDMYCRGLYGSSDKGSVYGALLDALERAGRVCDFGPRDAILDGNAHGGFYDFLRMAAPADAPLDGVHAVFDLGVSDATAIWWFRVGAPEVGADGRQRQGVDFIDYYEASGQGADHYFRVLDEKPYRLRHIWLPHDARNRTWGTLVTPLDRFIEECARKRWGDAGVSIGPEATLEQGLSAGRWLLEQPTRFHATRCAQGLEMLREYRFEWDDVLKVFSRKPVHNFASHGADAFRYAALVVKVAVLAQPKPPAPSGPPAVPVNRSFTLDSLWEAHHR